MIEVRATVNLPGLPVGRVADVDPEDPYIAAALKSQLLVPMSEESAAAIAVVTPGTADAGRDPTNE